MSQENTQGHGDATWPVNEDYTIRNGRLCATGDEVRHYDPLADEHIVTEFAKLYEGDENAVVEFARRRGLLGWGVVGTPQAGSDPDWISEPEDTDPISWVWGHASNVRIVLKLYRYLQRKDHDGLTSYLDTYSKRALSEIEGEIERAGGLRTPSMSVPASFGTEKGMIIIMQQHWSEPFTFPRGEPAKAAERIIEEIINPNLGQWITQTGLQYQVYADPLRLVLQCPCLLSAIYWHLANFVTKGRTVARCQNPTCGALFVVTDRRQRYCPPPAAQKGTTGSQCAAQHRKRRQRQKEGG